jgi:hypothetical protein
MIGGVRELPVALVNRSGETGRRQVLPAVLAMVESTRWRQRSDEVWCGNVGLRWASSSAKVSAVCLSSWRNQSGVNIAFTMM